MSLLGKGREDSFLLHTRQLLGFKTQSNLFTSLVYPPNLPVISVQSHFWPHVLEKFPRIGTDSGERGARPRGPVGGWAVLLGSFDTRLSVSNDEVMKGMEGPRAGSHAGPLSLCCPPFPHSQRLQSAVGPAYPGGSRSLSRQGPPLCLEIKAVNQLLLGPLTVPLVGQQLFSQPTPARAEGPWGPRGGTRWLCWLPIRTGRKQRTSRTS